MCLSGACVHTLLNHTREVMIVKQVGDNLLASGSSDGTIRLWNVTTGRFLRTIGNHSTFGVNAIERVSERVLASASDDTTIRLWDMETGACVRTFYGHFNKVWSLRLMSGQRLASGSADRTIKIWDLENGECLRTIVASVSENTINGLELLSES